MQEVNTQQHMPLNATEAPNLPKIPRSRIQEYTFFIYIAQ